MAAQQNRSNQFSKTKLCRFEAAGMCAKGTACPFAHGREELRPMPDLRFTKICKALIETGVCEDPACTYAHSKVELRLTPGGIAHRKTKLCRFIQNGRCKLGLRCGFAHSVEELGSEHLPQAPQGAPGAAAACGPQAAAPPAPPPPWNEERAPAPARTSTVSRATSASEPALQSPMYVQVRPNLRPDNDMHLEGLSLAASPWDGAVGGYFGDPNARSMLRPLPPGNVQVDQTNDVWSAKGVLLNTVDAQPVHPIRAVRSSASTLCSLGDTATESATLGAVPEELHVFPSLASAVYSGPPQPQPQKPPPFSGSWPMHGRSSSTGL